MGVKKHYTGGSRETVGGRINNQLLPTFGDMQMCDIRHSTVKSWLADLRTTPSKRTKRPLTPTTVARVYDALAGIMSSAMRDKVIAVNPLDGITYPNPPKTKRIVTVWESQTVNVLLAGVPDREHAIPLIAGTCWHRQGEAFAVAVEDINFLRKEITVRHQVQRVNGKLTLIPCKGQKVRTVPLPDITAQGLSTHIERYGTTPVRCECCDRVNHVLFATNGKLPADQTWNTKVWHPAVTSAGMTPSRSTGLHQLRHFYASLLIDGGASPKQVQEYMGHASITITMDLYGHLFESSHDKARSIVDAAFTLNDAQQLPSSGVAGAYPVRTREIN
jgi:integrase